MNTKTEINRSIKILNTIKTLHLWLEQGNEIYNNLGIKVKQGNDIYNNLGIEFKHDNKPFDEYVKLTPKEFRKLLADNHKFHYKISNNLFNQKCHNSPSFRWGM